MAHILVVEDDADISRLLCRILSKGGYEAVPAYSGTEAKLRLEMSEPDLILLDLMLPGVNGEEIISYVRDELKKSIPIIVLSFLTGGMYFLFVAGAVLAVLLFSGDRRNGEMKNAVAFIQFFEKELIAGLGWLAVIYLIPSICYSTGFQFETMAKIAAWMPRNYLLTGVTAGMNGYECLWSEPEGALKCVIAGVIGIVVFLILGALINRRKEI